MHIQKAPVGLPSALPRVKSASPEAQPANPAPANPAPADPAPSQGDHHPHGLGGTLMHVGHDAAMVAMSLPGGSHHHQVLDSSICSSRPPAASGHAQHGHSHHGHAHGHSHQGQAHHSGHEHGHHGGHHGHHGGGGWLHHGSAAVSGLVSVAAAVHGVQMVQSKDNFTRLEGVNHLVMSASTATMAGAMWAPQAGLGGLSTGLMAAHGLGEVALGAYQVARGVKKDCQHDKLGGLLKTIHGGCLAAAQAFPGAALPLYLGMSAATMAQLSLQQSGHVH